MQVITAEDFKTNQSKIKENKQTTTKPGQKDKPACQRERVSRHLDLYNQGIKWDKYYWYS